jgi:hypothetical protein
MRVPAGSHLAPRRAAGCNRKNTLSGKGIGLPGSSTPLTASVPRTPHQASVGLAAGHSRHASTIDHMHTRTARFADLRDHALLLMNWRDWHGLHGCCEGQSKNNSCQPDHPF